MRTEAGKMPECLIFLIRNGLGVSNDRFGFKQLLIGLAFIEGGFGRDFIAIDVLMPAFHALLDLRRQIGSIAIAV